jgi:hypothetical protein
VPPWTGSAISEDMSDHEDFKPGSFNCGLGADSGSYVVVGGSGCFISGNFVV